MGSGLLNHLRIAELPPPGVGWAGGGEVSSGEAARGSARTGAVPGQRWHREMLFHSTCGGDLECLATSSHGGRVVSQKQLDVDMTGRRCGARTVPDRRSDRAVKALATGRA